VSVYNVIYANTNDFAVTSSNATYATAASGSGLSVTSAATNARIGQTTGFSIVQYFASFDTSGAPSATTAELRLTAHTTGGATGELYEVARYAWASAATSAFRDPTALGALTVAGTGTNPATADTPFTVSFSTAEYTSSSTMKVVVYAQNQRTAVAPVVTNWGIHTADATGTTNDPYLLVTTGSSWQLVGVSDQVQVTGTTHTLVTTGISGLTTGDLLVACISSRIASTTAVTLPSGGEWTLVEDELNNNTATNTSATPSGTMAYCVRGASDPNLTFTHPTAPSVALGRIVAYRNNALTGVLDTQTNFTTATNVTAISGTGLTTSQDDDLIVAMRAGGQESTLTSFAAATDPTTASGATNTTSHPAPNAWTERADATTTTGADTALSIYDTVKTAAGSTGNLTATASQASAHVVIAGAFKIVAATNKTISAGAGSYALTGTAASPELGRKTAADSGSYALTGTDATFKKGYKLAGDTGSYALTGTAATLRHAWKIVPDAGAYALTGTNATLRRNLPLVPDSGSYALTGTDATPKHGWRVAVDPGSYTLTGTAATLRHAWRLAVDSGSYSLSGTDASGRYGYRVGAGAGSYALTGTDATLTKSGAANEYSIAADAGSYSLTGTDASPEHGWRVAADVGSYTLTGTDATLRHAWRIAAAAGSYSLSGTDASPEHGWKIGAGAGSYALSGTDATLRHGWKIVAGTGSYELTGTDATPKHGWRISAEGGAYSLTGTDATPSKTGVYAIGADAGAYALSGTDATVRLARLLVPANGNYELTGTDATPTYVAVETPTRRGDDAGPIAARRRRIRPEEIIAIVEAVKAAEEEAKPKPTAKKRKALARKIVETIDEDNIFTQALKKPVAQFVRQEVAQVYQPGVSWDEVYEHVARIIEAAQAEARRINQEIEDEDEFLILMAA
jgi:hypothetical protein